MILSLNMPQLGALMVQGVIQEIHVSEGCRIDAGSKLFDIRVDLSEVAPQDCPPVSFFQMVSREKGWVRQLNCAIGQSHSVGQVLAVVSSDQDEPCDTSPLRPLRISTVGVLSAPEW
jgi:pyruvate/2-oxoglutarate dehydrogenase complex dihydrolipoamide acyltransferase (E2) component